MSQDFGGAVSIRLEKLLAEALAEAPAQAFADESFVPNLDRVLAAAARLPLTAAGMQGLEANLQRLLVNRLRLEADVLLHPEILDEDVSDPIVVIGLPRSGTTKLQRLLSADPNLQPTPVWQMLNPAPFPGEVRGDPELRIEWAGRMLSVASHTGESYRVMHDFKAMEPDETSFLTIGNFDCVMQFIPLPDHSYLEWARSMSRLQSIAYVKTMLQYLQWQQGARRRPWVIKNPGHTGEIAEVVELFPNATFVMSRRDLATTMASSMRMMTEILPQTLTSIDHARLAEDTVGYWAYELDRYQGQRRELGGRIRILEIPYRRCVEDSINVARELYALHGLAWTQEGEAAMLAWEGANPRHKYGSYGYALEDFGWDAGRVESAFGEIAQEWKGM